MRQVLIVEDIADVRRALCEVATRAFPGIGIGQAASVAEAREQLSRSDFDLLLLDIGLPDGNGVQIVDEAVGRVPQIVITTIFDDDTHLFDALRAGANGYLLKDEPADRLVELLCGIAEGRPPLSASIARRMLHFFRPAASPLRDGPARTPLSPRETEVLTLIARGYTVRDVAAALNMTYNTAAGHLKGIYHKLSVNSRAEATMEAIRLGVVRATP